jgi:hypothetical protein
VTNQKNKGKKLERVATVELVQDGGWFINKTDSKGKSVKTEVNISYIVYDAKAAFDQSRPLTNSKNEYNSAKIAKVWENIIKSAKAYPYAEQAGWDSDPKGKFIKNFPNSLYVIPSGGQAVFNQTNNSNTFVHWLLRENMLPAFDLTTGGFFGKSRTYAGAIRPSPISIPKGETWSHPSK